MFVWICKSFLGGERTLSGKSKKLNKKGLGGVPSCDFNRFPQAHASKTESFYEVRDFLEEVHTGLDEFSRRWHFVTMVFSQSGCWRVVVGVGRHFCNGEECWLPSSRMKLGIKSTTANLSPAAHNVHNSIQTRFSSCVILESFPAHPSSKLSRTQHVRLRP